LVIGCDRPNVDAAAVAATASASARPAQSAVATPTAAASSSAAPASSYAGEWRGDYESKRARVDVPRGNPWPGWKKDDGSRLGTGSVKLTIAADGEISGEASGALGALWLRGRLEGDAIRAGVSPARADEVGAMTGTLTGNTRAQAIQATIRAASPDGEVVRVAEVTLHKKNESGDEAPH
jgi:hypothetical protein